MGRPNGVFAKIQEEPTAVTVHSLGHCTTLVLQDVGKKVKPVRDALDITKEISKLIKFSRKREIMFVKNQIAASGYLQTGDVPTVGPNIK